MFVFLQLQKPEEKAEQQVQQAHLFAYEQKGIELITQFPAILADISGQPISKEFERLKLPDFKNISDFNSYSIQGKDYSKGILDATEKTYTIIEIKNPEYEQARNKEDTAFNSLPVSMQNRIIEDIKSGRPSAWVAQNSSPDPKMKAWLEASHILKNAPKEIYIIKDEQTGRTIISSKQPDYLSKEGEPVYTNMGMFFTYKGEKLKEAFKPQIEGEQIGQYIAKEFAERCNTTTKEPDKTVMQKFEAVELNGQPFWVKKSAQLEDKTQTEGIMK